MQTLTDDYTTAEATELSPDEITRRVAVLRRFKTLLTQQRDRFRSYLEMLDKQHEIIDSGSADDLLSHVELEEKIVADIFSIQKVIYPLEDMYHAVIGGYVPTHGGLSSSGLQSDDEVPSLKAALDDLKDQVVIRQSRNKELLSRRIAELRMEIKTMRENPYAAKSHRSVYGSSGTASLVDIKG